MGAAHGVECVQVVARQHVEHLDQDHAPGRRRRRAHHPYIPIVTPQRRTLDHSVLGQVVRAPDSAVGANALDQLAPHLAAVKPLTPFVGQALQGRRQVGLGHDPVLGRHLAASQILSSRSRRGPQGCEAEGRQAPVVVGRFAAPANDGRCCPPAFRVVDDLGLPPLHYGHTGVGCPEIDSDYLAHFSILLALNMFMTRFLFFD